MFRSLFFILLFFILYSFILLFFYSAGVVFLFLLFLTFWVGLIWGLRLDF
ncbi:putative membrane protein [Helicobacter pylori Hp P-13]|nr:putative membrane protein [Helicobacter pylori Hp P-13]